MCVIFAFVLSGCVSGSGSQADDAKPSDTKGDSKQTMPSAAVEDNGGKDTDAGPTWHGTIKEIMTKRCNGCLLYTSPSPRD